MDGVITEAATKKRGRPRKYTFWENHAGYEEREGRNLQNYVNAEDCVCTLWELADEAEKSGDDTAHRDYEYLVWWFEDTGEGDGRETNHYRHQGVAEQIGRMHRAGRIDDRELVRLVKWSRHKIDVESRTSRDVEKELRQYHKSLRLSVAATENKEG